VLCFYPLKLSSFKTGKEKFSGSPFCQTDRLPLVKNYGKVFFELFFTLQRAPMGLARKGFFQYLKKTKISRKCKASLAKYLAKSSKFARKSSPIYVKSQNFPILAMLTQLTEVFCATLEHALQALVKGLVL
jgi:hypothetical protein